MSGPEAPKATDATDDIDGADRQGAIHERARNVIVEASAGTGKTSLVVDSLGAGTNLKYLIAM
jgi:hypothetical protein